MHHRGHPLAHIRPKIFDIQSDSVSIRIPCSSINSMAHGVCVHYIDEFKEIQASKCFGLPNKPNPSIDGRWSAWDDEMRCAAPCALTLPVRNRDSALNTQSIDFINGKSEWNFNRRTCSNPNQLGKGAPCNAENPNTSTKMAEFNVSQESQCKNPWELSRESDGCECGCNFSSDGGVIYSPAPWRCTSDKIVWTFDCDDCDYLVLEVLYHGIAEAEAVEITEQNARNDTYKIDSIGLTQHFTKRATITYRRNSANAVGCGFALKITTASDKLLIPKSELTTGSGNLTETEISVAANFGIWGILLCTGFILLIIIASIFNCRNGEKEPEKNPVQSSNGDFDKYTDINNINSSPTKIRPTAACFSLAQQQLRLMKAEGRNDGKKFENNFLLDLLRLF